MDSQPAFSSPPASSLRPTGMCSCQGRWDSRAPAGERWKVLSCLLAGFISSPGNTVRAEEGTVFTNHHLL